MTPYDLLELGIDANFPTDAPVPEPIDLPEPPDCPPPCPPPPCGPPDLLYNLARMVRGAKGDPGKDGLDGNDYVLTSADKAEIADLVTPPMERITNTELEQMLR